MITQQLLSLEISLVYFGVVILLYPMDVVTGYIMQIKIRKLLFMQARVGRQKINCTSSSSNTRSVCSSFVSS
jgi:hypothetical protein